MLQPILELESSEEVYVAWAIIFCCFEDRIWKLRNEFFRWLGKQFGAEHFDPVTIAGGPMAFAEDDLLRKEFALNEIRISQLAHKTNKVILVFHRDCGAYKEMGKTFATCEEELRHHEAACARAKATILGRFPEMTVESYIADFHGLHRVCE
jgi:hypothetical protein